MNYQERSASWARTKERAAIFLSGCLLAGLAPAGFTQTNELPCEWRSAYDEAEHNFLFAFSNQHTRMDSKPSNITKFDPEDGRLDESGNVDRIRNILFGSQMRDYDGRFQKLEERLGREAGELRRELQRQLQALEAFMKGEVESMTNRLKTEQAERGQAVERLNREMMETAKGLEMKISHLDGQAAKDIRDLREQLLEQSKALSAEMKEKHDQMKGHLDKEAGQIRDAMTGREALAEMLSEVALRLKNEFRVPGAS